MNIVERDGRYFVQCSDGEVERTLEQLRATAEGHQAAIQASVDRLEGIQRYANTWLSMHGGNTWGVADVPKDADSVIRNRLFFEAIEQSFLDDLQSGKGIESAVRMCDDFISRLKADKANPYGRKDLLKFQIQGWKDIKFRLQQKASTPVPSAPAPPSPPPAPHAFAALLRNYTLADLTALLTELGLLDTTRRPTPAASPGAWAGVIYGLMEARPARLDGSQKAACEAFQKEFGAVVSVRLVNTGIGKQNSKSEKVRDEVLRLLAQ